MGYRSFDQIQNESTGTFDEILLEILSIICFSLWRSLCIVYDASTFGVPRSKIWRMLGNVGIETVLGVVPLLGDALDVVFKANLRNLAIIEVHLNSVR